MQSIVIFIAIFVFITLYSNIQPVSCYDDYGGGYDSGSDYGYGGSDGGYGDESSLSTENQATLLNSIDEVNAFIMDKDDIPIVLGYFDPENIDDIEVYQKVSNSNSPNYAFAIVSSKEILEEMKYDGSAVFVYPPSKYINKKFEKSRSRYPGKHLKQDTFEKFINDKSFPLVSIRDDKSNPRFAKSKHPILSIYATIDLKRNQKGYDYIVNRLRKIAIEYKNKIVVSVSDRSEQSVWLNNNWKDAKQMSTKEILVAIIDSHRNLVYKMKGEFNIENIQSFIKQFYDGLLVSESIVEVEKVGTKDEENEDGDIDESAVVKLENSNVDEIITNSNKNILVEFYAPWCGHCKALKPKYAKLAQHYKDDNEVTIAAMDATANDVPKDFDVSGYPSLFFIPAGSKSPMSYEGERSVNAMKNFIESNRKSIKDEL